MTPSHPKTELEKNSISNEEMLLLPLRAYAGKVVLVQTAAELESTVKALEHVTVLGFDTLLVDLATDLKINTIIRGLRAVSDFEFELQMGYANSSINKNLETVYLMPTLEHAFVSSTIVREIIRFKGKFEHLVPKKVVECM